MRNETACLFETLYSKHEIVSHMKRAFQIGHQLFYATPKNQAPDHSTTATTGITTHRTLAEEPPKYSLIIYAPQRNILMKSSSNTEQNYVPHKEGVSSAHL